MLIRRRACRLNDENIRAANVLADLEIELAVRESISTGFSEIADHLCTDLFSQRRMRIARENFDVSSYAHKTDKTDNKL